MLKPRRSACRLVPAWVGSPIGSLLVGCVVAPLAIIACLSAVLRHAVLHPLFVNPAARARAAEARVAAAIAFLNQSSAHVPEPGPVDICVVVQAAPRSEPYVARTLASTLDQEPGVPAARISVVGDDPTAQAAKHIVRVESLADALAKAPTALQAADKRAANNAQKRVWHSRQRVHYALALHVCERDADCALCLVLENDALLARDALRRAVDAARRLDGEDAAWGMLRLFKTHHFEGWDARNWMPDLVLVFAAGAIAGQCACRRGLLGGAWAALGGYLLGRQHVLLLAWGSGLVPSSDSVSSIAHVYPRAVLADLIANIAAPCCADEADYPVDVFIGRGGLPGARAGLWELRPNAVQHVGARSSWSREGEQAGWWRDMPESLSFRGNGVRF